MARPPDQAKRAELLAGVVEYIAQYGLGALSLRPLAAALGTSSRMLIHYFGTKEQMLILALEAQRPRIAAWLADVQDARTLCERLRESTGDLTDQSVRSVGVVLQVLAAASVPDSPFADYAVDAVRVLVTALTEVLHRFDPPVADAEATATLLISAMRGLVLDRLVTGDVDRVDRASRQLIEQSLRPALISPTSPAGLSGS